MLLPSRLARQNRFSATPDSPPLLLAVPGRTDALEVLSRELPGRLPGRLCCEARDAGRARAALLLGRLLCCEPEALPEVGEPPLLALGARPPVG